VVVTSQPSGSIWVNAAIIATFAGALVFVASYAWRTRGAWWGTAVGRNVMALMSVILIVSALAVASIIWGTDWPHRNVIRFVAWSLVAVCVWWRVVILWRIQHRQK
jgi:predicted TIM-barrel fold metal-dependent hydrolase